MSGVRMLHMFERFDGNLLRCTQYYTMALMIFS